MKLYFSLSRGLLAALLCIILSTLLISGSFVSAINQSKNGSTNALRCEFAQSIGCEIKEELLSQKEITIPIEFGEVYNSYNSLQKRAGFDLERYKGANATVYTYQVLSHGAFKKDDNVRLNLIVYKGKIIGGDISSVDLSGKMIPLLREEELYGKTAS